MHVHSSLTGSKLLINALYCQTVFVYTAVMEASYSDNSLNNFKMSLFLLTAQLYGVIYAHVLHKCKLMLNLRY